MKLTPRQREVIEKMKLGHRLRRRFLCLLYSPHGGCSEVNRRTVDSLAKKELIKISAVAGWNRITNYYKLTQKGKEA